MSRPRTLTFALPAWLRWLAARWVLLFMALLGLTLPLPRHLLPDTAAWLHPASALLANGTARLLTGKSAGDVTVSDAPGMAAHVANMAALALLVAIGWQAASRRRPLLARLSGWVSVVARYGLAWTMLVYGLNKVFKYQFYTPEPNILATPFGTLSRDILYWSTMGVSRPYCMFLGSAEALAAVLLFFRRTSLAGALISAMILVNVAAVNLAYDIDVKLLSCLLLWLACVVLWQERRTLGVLVGMKVRVWSNVQPHRVARPALHTALKAAVIIWLLADAAWPYLRSGNFNDDAAPRPPLHGAYRVLHSSGGWRRFFVHRQGYFILQDSNDRFQDVPLETDTLTKQLWLSPVQDSLDYALDYAWLPDSVITLRGMVSGDTFWVDARKEP